MVLPFFNPGTTQGIEYERAPILGQFISIADRDALPTSFPFTQWGDQLARYTDYWSHFRGDVLRKQIATTSSGAKLLKYPLGINVTRRIARKHAAVLMGEETFDSTKPLVKMQVVPKLPVTGEEASNEVKEMAKAFQNIINEVWLASNGRGLQMENAILSQFLGGCVFHLRWEPWREDLTIPIVIHNLPADFFLPVPSSESPWRLLKAFVAYRIPSAVATLQYGVPDSENPFVIYCEEWTETNYSIYLDGKPLEAKYGDRVIRYDNLPNPFGFVPFVYIPHIREGSFYGSSIVEDIRGLQEEYNLRMADLGDIVRLTSRRPRYGVNISKTLKSQPVGDTGLFYIDLGNENPNYKNPPVMTTEETPDYPNGMMDFAQGGLWNQILREADIGDIAFGEDEGSQRSALTLAFRMYPSTSHARMERTFWDDGLARIAWMIGRMLVVNQDAPLSDGKSVSEIIKFKLPKYFWKVLQVKADWNPMIPRDREQMITEIITMSQAGLMAPRTAILERGNVANVQEELDEIMEWEKFKSELEVKAQAKAKVPQPEKTLAAGDDGK